MSLSHNLGGSPSLKQQAYDVLLHMMVSGELKPGVRLTEEDLSNTLNISRAPIREALNMLERDGFVKIIPRKGAIVPEISKKDLLDVWNCRLVLEPFAAKEAVTYIPKDSLIECLNTIIELENSPYDYSKYVESDLMVHQLYYQYSDNKYLISILNNLKTHSTRMRWLSEINSSDNDFAVKSIREHKEIVLAFISGNGDSVYNAVYQHLKNSCERLLSTFP